MGKASNNRIIDETFIGLLDPKEVHELGREDITSDRPGQSLLQIVQEFGRKGFDQITEERAAQRAALESADVSQKGKKLADFGLDINNGPAHELTLDDGE